MPKEWIARYKGQFDQGWDKLREETLARQKKLGVVPPDTKLAPKPAAIKDWDKLTPDEQRLFAHQMEVFAGYGEFADHEAGRLVQAIEDMGQMDNTLIFYILGDNGASAEGGMNGLFNEATYFNGVAGKGRGYLEALRRAGRPHVIRPLRGGVGRGGGYAVHLDEAGRRELRRHPQRDGRPLAQAHQGPRRGAVAVASRHRHRADDPGSGRPARAERR